MGIEIEMKMEMETNWIPSGVIYRNFYFYFFVKIFEIVYGMNVILKRFWIWLICIENENIFNFI